MSYRSSLSDRDKEEASLRVVPRDLHFGLPPPSKNSTAFCPKEATDETCFPSYSRKAWKEGPRQGRYCANLFFNPFGREECVQGPCGIEWIGFFDFHPPPSPLLPPRISPRPDYLLRGMEHRRFGYSTRCLCSGGMRVQFCECLLFRGMGLEGCDDMGLKLFLTRFV